MCVVCEVLDCREALDCADRTLGIVGGVRVVGVGNGGVLDSLRDDHMDESVLFVDRTRSTRSSMASRVCWEMAEIPSSNVRVLGMCNSLDDKGATLISLRGGEETGKGLLFVFVATAAGEPEVEAGGARATAVSRSEDTACAARF